MNTACEPAIGRWTNIGFGCDCVHSPSWQWQWDTCDGPMHLPYVRCRPCAPPEPEPLPCQPAPMMSSTSWVYCSSTDEGGEG